MNQDFALEATPGIARRLIQIARLCRVDLDPAISEMAKTGLIPEEEFAPYAMAEAEKAAIQTITDLNFRAVVPGPTNRLNYTALVAAKIAGISPIVVYTRPSYTWDHLAKQVGFKPNEDFFTLRPPHQTEVLDANFVKEHRHGLLLMDQGTLGGMSLCCNILAMDFARTLYLCAPSAFGTSQPIRTLFPDAPIDILDKDYFSQRSYEGWGFRKPTEADASYFLNTVTEMVNFAPVVESDPIAPPDEDDDVTWDGIAYNYFDFTTL